MVYATIDDTLRLTNRSNEPAEYLFGLTTPGRGNRCASLDDLPQQVRAAAGARSSL
jgi:hypothetical protein